MPDFLSVSDAVREVARLRGVTISPRLLTDLIYKGAFEFECPMVVGRRAIHARHMDALLSTLEQRGYLTPERRAVASA
jgi:hypothetical protein